MPMSQKQKKLLSAIENFCTQEGARFTEARQHVASIIADSAKPITAYEILDQLAQHIKNPKPPTVYRAIGFLIEHNFVHRIESLNAFIACQTDHLHMGSQFMICDLCGHVAETHLCSIPTTLRDSVDKQGFRPVSWNVEIHGQCKECQKP
jgi:Fur family zinc uptake transcriptional regulator